MEKRERLKVKREILFVIDSLDCAGAEKSLITLLSLLDYSKYSVDLMLFAHGKLLEKLVPSEVNILKPIKYMEFSTLSLVNALIYSVIKFDFKMLFSRIKYSIRIRNGEFSNRQKARLFWQSVSRLIEDNSKIYDIAVSYAQGIPTFYVAEKVKADKKFAWVNANYRLDEKEKDFQNRFYDQYNKIVAVSDTARLAFLETFPNYTEKMEVIIDINNPSLIMKMADSGEGYQDNFDGIRILTIGRLDQLKGYDIALNACKKLIDNGIKFKWYVLGRGPLKDEIESYIKENNIAEYFVLLGIKSNPYPFIKNCDIYVQTSRSEGFGLAIAEARMLNIPVVTTRFEGVYNQMVEGNNGLIVDMNADAVCAGILRLINDISLREHIVQYLQTEKKGNIEEIDKFYRLLE